MVMMSYGRKNVFYPIDNFYNVRIFVQEVMLKTHLNVNISNLGCMAVNFLLNVGFDVSKACKLIEVSSEGLPCVI